MKAITLMQPWATLVAIGAKKIETRSWKTSYRGKLAVHSSKKLTDENWALCWREPFHNALHDYMGFSLNDKNMVSWLGSVLAICNLRDCIPVEEIRSTISDTEKCFGDCSDGRFAWQLELIKTFDKPFPAKGKQGLWEWEGAK